MHMKKSLLLLLPVVAFAAPAQAQDSTDTRSGLRVELVGLLDDIDADIGRDSNEFNPIRDADVDGAFGIGIGFDFVRGPGFGVGIDAEITQSTARQNVIVGPANPNAFPQPQPDRRAGAVNFENDLYVGGRVTAPISGRFSVVGKLGYTALKTDFDITLEEFEDDERFQSDRLSGIRAGIGVHMNSEDDNTYYGLEYRYSNYERSLVRHQFGLVIGARF
jgi:opacity protein-like surface antigen